MILCFSLCLTLVVSLAIPFAARAQTDDEKAVAAIYDERLTSGEMYHLLGDLCKNIGPRLSGSEGAERAVEWAREVMEGYGFDRVYLQEVMVPHWERGDAEQVRIVNVEEGMIELRALAPRRVGTYRTGGDHCGSGSGPFPGRGGRSRPRCH